MTRPAAEVLAEQRDALLELPGVVGVGLGARGDEACIRLFVDELTAEVRAAIPTEIEGVAVVAVPTGGLEALGGD